MQLYQRDLDGPHRHLFCGHWNGSPLEIGMQPERLREVPAAEIHHYHDYHEYYVVLEGRAILEVQGENVTLEPGVVIMIEPREAHSITWIDPDQGCRWVIVKERSAPDSKHPASPDQRPDS